MNDDTKLAKWLSGDLDPVQLADFEKSPEYLSYKRIASQFDKLEKPAFDKDAILVNVLSHSKTGTKIIPLYKRFAWQAAAVVVLFLSVAYFYTLPDHVSAAFAETQTFSLPDQSVVVLNAGSEASYSSWKWNTKREVSLKGEAYFKVAKGKKFTVTTDLGAVTVLGTRFNVRARGHRLDVSCFEGKVKVAFRQQSVVLLPGQRIVFNDSTESTVMPQRLAVPSWTINEIEFTSENLENVLAELERHYDITITTGLRSQQLFTGTLPGKDLDGALKVLSLTYHLKVRKSGSSVTFIPLNAGA